MIKASIILLTYNSSKTIKSVLDGIVKQKFSDYEIICIDSSSTDDTLDIVKDYPVRIITIKPEDFGHGKTRNYAIKFSSGEFLVFLTHDSVPEGENWLSEMIKPFDDSSVAGVYGRQIPRPDESPLDKYFQSSVYGDKPIIWKNDNWTQGDNIFSDANSAIRKSILIEHPFINNIIVSEDYEWAGRVLNLRFKIIYSTSARVIHSHKYNLRQLFKRNFDIGVSYLTIYKDNKEPSQFISKALKIVLNEIKSLYNSGFVWLIPFAIIRDFIRLLAIQLGKFEWLFPKSIKRNYLSAQKWYWK